MVEEFHEITHRTFLDVDIDKQRLGMIFNLIICVLERFYKTLSATHPVYLINHRKNCHRVVW